jgi:hypothetical protein
MEASREGDGMDVGLLVQAWLGVPIPVHLVTLAWLISGYPPNLGPGVTEANARRIRIGMSLDQVEAVFGKSPDDYEGCADGAECTWVGYQGVALLCVDEQDRVDWVHFWSTLGSLPDLAGITPIPAVTEANAHRIWRGMHLDDVNGIFGGPPKVTVQTTRGMRHTWMSNRGVAKVLIDEEDRVLDVDFSPLQRSRLDRLLAWFGW